MSHLIASFCKTKITNNDLSIMQEDIGKFEISMNDFLLSQDFKALGYLL